MTGLHTSLQAENSEKKATLQEVEAVVAVVGVSDTCLERLLTVLLFCCRNVTI